MAKGLLFMAFDFSTAHADEFHDWYDHEHIPERLRVPGFLNAERWIADDNPMTHVATYDLETASVLASAPYLAVAGANQSVWTKRVTGMCRRIMRYEGEQLVPGELLAPPGGRPAGRLYERRSGRRGRVHRMVQYRTSASARRRSRRPRGPPLPRHGYGIGTSLPRAVSFA